MKRGTRDIIELMSYIRSGERNIAVVDLSTILTSINETIIGFLSRLWNSRLLISSYIIAFIVFYLMIIECDKRWSIFSEQEIPSLYFHIVIALVFSIAFVEIIVFLHHWNREKNIWSNLTEEEKSFIDYYVERKTKTRYVTVYNGTYTNSGIINPLIQKKILYLASNMSEYRGESRMSAKQQFPINIHDGAYKYFCKTRL